LSGGFIILVNYYLLKLPAMNTKIKTGLAAILLLAISCKERKQHNSTILDR
jgi:hypothetical protein